MQLSQCVRVIAASCAAVLIVACASTVPPVTPQMAATAGQPAALLEQGRRLYGGPCSACHAPYAPSAYSAEEWPSIVSDMSERSKFTAPQHDAVLAYVLAARQAIPQTR
jgi:mono/diheme cytochrome c family protein